MADPTTGFAATITPPPPTTGVMQSLSALTNTTSSYLRVPSGKNIVWVPLRYAYKVERFLLNTLPRQAARMLHLDFFIQAAGAGAGADVAGEAAAGAAAQVADAAGQAGDTWGGALQEVFGFHNVRSLGGMLSYMTSRWSITCFTMALILNRVTVYAASRQRIHLTWDKRLALRIIPILLFISQIHSLLQGIRCQTSPDWSLYRYGSSGKQPALDWSSHGGILHSLSSQALFWEDDDVACAAVHMGKADANSTASHGSFSLLWPTFVRLCVSHFVETLSCSLQQRPVMTETGMSIFEHSLAFSEAEAMLGHSVGLNAFGAAKPGSNMANRTAEIVKEADIDTASTSRPFVLDKVNVPVEVLLIALISCCNSLTSNLIAVFNRQHKWRLVNTTIWGVCYMTAFVWGFFNSTATQGDITSGFLRFPTVCIVGFIPHLLIVIGMAFCAGIYLLALTLTAMSLETNPAIRRPGSFSERFQIAHENLQAGMQIKGFELRWYEDFYSALLRIGFSVLSAASEAVFMNEGRAVEVRRLTWLEEERFDELEAAKGTKQPIGASFHIHEEYGLPGGGKTPFQSGYGKERKIEDPKNKGKADDIHIQPGPNGVGALQRSTRFWVLFLFFKGIFYLVTGWIAFGIGSALDLVGLTWRPRWLRNLIGKSLKRSAVQEDQNNGLRGHDYALEFWMLDERGELRTPRNEAYDIEPEMRRRLAHEGGRADGNLEKKLDRKLYDWWKMGGWFGSEDFSGEYRPDVDDDDDTTSVISMSTNISASTNTDDDAGWEELEGLSSGQITPTQRDFTRESTPMAETDLMPLDASTLSRLLNPRDATARAEARILSSHLSAPEYRIMTRSQYRRELEQERSRLLLVGHSPATKSSSSSPPTRPTLDEESEMLEQLIIERRSHRQSTATPNDDLNSPSGPLCVVCQTSPRSIIAWPCRCLCVCEDCRVSLAMNNFGNCVTCRRDVGGFVRLWVP